MPALTNAGITGYIGPLYQPIALPVVSALSTTHERPSQVVTTLAGRRVAFVSQTQRRGWNVAVNGARPDEIGAFLEMVRAGAGPWWWASPLAQVTNLLPPDVASFAIVPFNSQVRGGMDTPDGYAPVSLAAATTGALIQFGRVPVIAGQQVTLSAYFNAPASGTSLGVGWYDAAGAYLTGNSVSVPVASSTVRHSLTMAAPAAARACGFRVYSNNPFTRPCVTWTPDLLPWSVGNGCEQATITNVNANTVATYAQPWAPRTQAITFDVTEVN